MLQKLLKGGETLPGPNGGGQPDKPGISSNSPKDMNDPANQKLANAIKSVKKIYIIR